MRERLLDLVRCPACGQALGLEEDVHEGPEVVTGLLVCEEEHVYPIVKAIPRLLDPQSLRESLRRYHPGEWERLRGRLRSDGPWEEDGGGADADTTRRTLRSFSFQWNTFSDMFEHWEENFRSYFEPLVGREEFRGRLVLDAGCGFGRHAYYAGMYGAEVVAVDLSEAVEAAYQNTRDLEHVHVVQGNIYHPPVAPVFDLVYCVGVIQHLPDPAGGFASLATRVRTGGRIFVWVYGRRRGIYRLVDLMRHVTTRMSPGGLYQVTRVLNLAGYVVFCAPYRGLRAVPGLRGVTERLPFTRYADLPLRVGHADWFDRLSVPSTVYFERHDVESWFHAACLAHVEISPRDGIGWRAVGTRAPSPARVGVPVPR